MKTKPFRAMILEQEKINLETLAMGDGVQRGMFFDTSGRLRKEMVSATANHSFIYKTVSGLPFKWVNL